MVRALGADRRSQRLGQRPASGRLGLLCDPGQVILVIFPPVLLRDN